MRYVAGSLNLLAGRMGHAGSGRKQAIEVVQIERLVENQEAALLEPVRTAVQIIACGGTDNDWNVRSWLRGLQPLENLPPAVIRFHAEVEEDDVGLFALDAQIGIGLPVALDNFPAMIAQDIGHQFGEVRVVVDNCSANHRPLPPLADGLQSNDRACNVITQMREELEQAWLTSAGMRLAQVRILTARENTRTAMSRDAIAWIPIKVLAQRPRGWTSVGLKAVALVYAR